MPAIGFLTVVEHEDQSLYGGYLILNPSGRPLEFHCTAPVRANRAQEILYGTTLKPYLIGEQIGQTLLAKAKSKPMFVCTDDERAMSVRSHVKTPVLLVQSSTEESGSSGDQYRVDGSHELSKPNSRSFFEFDGVQATVSPVHERDRETVLSAWEPFKDNLDLIEPFSRIREAIEEAQRSATR